MSTPFRRGALLVVLALVLEYLVLPQVAGERRSLHLLGQVNLGYVALGVVLEAVSLACYAQGFALTKTRTESQPYPPAGARLVVFGFIRPMAPRRTARHRSDLALSAATGPAARVSRCGQGGTAPGPGARPRNQAYPLVGQKRWKPPSLEV